MLEAKPPALAAEAKDLFDAWGVVYPGATCSPLAIANNVGRLRQGTAPSSKNGPMSEYPKSWNGIAKALAKMQEENPDR
jgi:hypothetical protein